MILHSNTLWFGLKITLFSLFSFYGVDEVNKYLNKIISGPLLLIWMNFSPSMGVYDYTR